MRTKLILAMIALLCAPVAGCAGGVGSVALAQDAGAAAPTPTAAAAPAPGPARAPAALAPVPPIPAPGSESTPVTDSTVVSTLAARVAAGNVTGAAELLAEPVGSAMR